MLQYNVTSKNTLSDVALTPNWMLNSVLWNEPPCTAIVMVLLLSSYKGMRVAELHLADLCRYNGQDQGGQP